MRLLPHPAIQFRLPDGRRSHHSSQQEWPDDLRQSLLFHRCNSFKNERTHHQDPLTGNLTAIFHPRRDSWADHFQWDEDGIYLTAITATGRATLLALQMNNDAIIDARRKWVAVGWHP
jgi:hypothetical protein